MVSYRRVSATLLAAYVHDLNPVLIRFSEKIMIRWYGVAYLLAFLAGYWLLKWLGERKFWVLPGSRAGDFISLCALGGVFVGGRLGYVLFYLIPDRGIGAVLQDPLVIFRVWDGGMSSHGGILGIVIVSWFFARKHQVSWLGLGDGICVVAPIGLLFGRVANFINGELYGRVAEGLAWAVKFPQALINPHTQESARFPEVAQAATAVDPTLVPSYAAMQAQGSQQFFDQMLAAGRTNPLVNEAIAPFLEARHPSQIYEGLLEGLLLFVILLGLRLRFRALPHGVLTGLFFILYAVFRISMEEYRLPDSALMAFDLTKGQFLSVFMLLAGAGFLGAGLWRGGRGVATI